MILTNVNSRAFHSPQSTGTLLHTICMMKRGGGGGGLRQLPSCHVTRDASPACPTLDVCTQVPEPWQKVAYPSHTSLGAWMADFGERTDFMRSWLTRRAPVSFWLPAFFQPQSFLTAVLQTHARAAGVSVDTVSFSVTVTDFAVPEVIATALEAGVYVHGLWLEGAQWNGTARFLDEIPVGKLHSEMPVVHFQPTSSPQPAANVYECPVYKTSARADSGSTASHDDSYITSVNLPVRPSTDSDFWTLRGAALLCLLSH